MTRRTKRGSSRLVPEAAVPERGVPRRVRVEGDVHRILTNLLRELSDPRVATATITGVRMSDDLQAARIFVRVGLVTEADDGTARTELMSGLKAASGKLRKQLGSSLRLRYTPALAFSYDEGPDAARRVEELLAEIRSEQGE